MKTIQVRWTRHADHCWRSRDELINDVLQWTATYGRAKAGWPAQTYIQQLCEDTGCGPEDLPEAMNDRKKCRESVRDIRACGTTWWQWWWWQAWVGVYQNYLFTDTSNVLIKVFFFHIRARINQTITIGELIVQDPKFKSNKVASHPHTYLADSRRGHWDFFSIELE